MKTKSNFPFFMIAVGVYALVFLPWLLTKGCFGDGLMYASIAQQLYQDNGAAYQLYFSLHEYHHFYGHPPFGLWLMRLMMSIIGDGYWFERVFSLIFLFGTLSVMYLFWRRLAPALPKNSFGLVMILWIMMPVNSWSYCNNMLENVLSFLCLSALLTYWISIERRRGVLSIVSGVFFVLAVMTKGPVALFVLPAYILIEFYHKTKIKEALFRCFWALLGSLVVGLLFFIPDGAANYFDHYLIIQVLDAIAEEGLINRLTIFRYAFFEIAIVCGVYVLFRITGLTESISRKSGLLFAIFLLASVPIVLSTKQMRFYLVPSLPYLAIGLGLLCRPIFIKTVSVSRFLQLISSMMILTGVSCMFVFAGNATRDDQVIQNIQAIKAALPNEKIIKWQGEPPSWNIVCYFSRYAGITISNDKRYPVDYYVLTQDNARFYCKASSEIDIELDQWVLCKK